MFIAQNNCEDPNFSDALASWTEVLVQERRAWNSFFFQLNQRVLRCCEDIDIATIDKTIACLPKRINMVIRKNGARLLTFN